MSASQNFKKPLFAGIDVGGTNIKIGIVDDQGQIVAKTKFPTQPDKSPEVAITQAKSGLEKLLEPTEFEWSDIRAAWHNFPIQEQLAKTLGKPVVYANDANAAGFGEYWVGGGRDYKSMVLLTLAESMGIWKPTPVRRRW